MTCFQRRVAKVLLSLAFVIAALAKIKPGAMALPEQFPGAHVAMALAAGLEFAVAIAMWTPLTTAACWVGVVFVSVGSLWYLALAAQPGGSCLCLGTVYLSPIQHAGVGVVLFVLCSMLIVNEKSVSFRAPS